MKDLQLDVTLTLVGPRQALLQQAKWPLALRVAAGFADKPGDSAEARAMVSKSLPWNLWPADLPELLLVDEKGTSIACRPEAPLDDKPAFLQAVKDSVQRRGTALCEPLGTLDFRSSASVHRDVEDDDDAPAAVPWPGLLQTLCALSQPTPSALRATWFFTIDRDKLCEQDAQGEWKLRPGATLCAAPAQLEGSPVSKVVPSPAATTFEYAGLVRTYCNVLILEEVLGHGLDELDNYWLTIRDSRDDSLLDLAHQLDAALTPAAMLGTLRLEELALACEFTEMGGATRACTEIEMANALAAWRPALDKAEAALTAAARKAVIQQTLEDAGVGAEVLRLRYREHATALLKDRLAATGTPVQVKAAQWPRIGELLSERLLPHAFEPAEPGPSHAGEGIRLVVGDERLRLAHESQTQVPALDEVAGVQLWARRSTDPAALGADAAKPATWHALTAGKYVLQGDKDTTRAGVERVFGCTAAYVDDVLYREYAYLGANMVCRNPLERAHRERMGEGDPGLMLARLERLAADSWELLAVPLRYGDHYEFAASVIDRAGGQALELTEPGMPWKPKLAGIAQLQPPQRDGVRFLRRVPVGTCNLVPPDDGWPQTPEGVVLRSLENEPPPPPGKRSASICLVPDDVQNFLQPADDDVGARPWPAQVSFAIEPPQTDEHTAMRWYMPPTNASRGEQEAALRQVRDIVAGILRRREAALADGGEAALVPDPAVSAIGIRWQVDGGKPEHVALPARRLELSVQVDDQTGFDGVGTFRVARGSYLRIGIHPLVGKADFERLDATALASMVEPRDWIAADGRVFRAFEEDVVFVECATQELPDPDAALLRLKPTKSGDVDVTYVFSQDARSHAFRHVHQMRLASERWTWRNLPIPPRDADMPTPGTEEWRRRLASGPPKAIADDNKRDADSELVDHFDVLSGVDNGFVAREDLVAAFPREVTDPAFTAAAIDGTVLFRDTREGTTPADYLRYQWTIRSRYSGVLKEPERSTDPVRRMALSFRGDDLRIKPPRILAVMPLLSRMANSPRKQADGDGTPFLVVLDEIWFREYGIGERLQARIAKVKREIGEPEPTALRSGPLPDHSLDTSLTGKLEGPVDLDCFGPFGFTLDRTDDQALANATAFVVYPPADTPPHFNLFVEFTRLLDLPSVKDGKPLRSDTTEAVPMYTLPDSADLWPGAREANKPVVLAAQPDGTFGYDAGQLHLLPFARARGSVMSQYRYLLIVGNMVRDGGRAVDVFLPTRALWLEGGTARPIGAADAALRKCSNGVIAEVLLSGRYDPKKKEVDPLADATGLGDLLKRMLPDSVARDAPGMFRRFSPVGPVLFQP